MNEQLTTKQRITEVCRPVPSQRKYVLYWMQASQRFHFNPALHYAQWIAHQQGLPLLVYFGLWDDYPEAQLRHFHFMWEGLKELYQTSLKHGIKLLIRLENPLNGAIELSREAVWVVTDQGYLKHQKDWKNELEKAIDCPLSKVESDACVPVTLAYPKEAWQAGHLRRKLIAKLKPYDIEWNSSPPSSDALQSLSWLKGIHPPSFKLSTLNCSNQVAPASWIKGGRKEALRRLKHFLKKDLPDYAERRNHLDHPTQSNLSPYLHFGQIAAMEVVQKVLEASSKVAEVFLDELIVRRELSFNYCHYNARYDKFEGLPDWVKITLDQHRIDTRPYTYELCEWEQAKTHDPYWNAAQKEMVQTGKMHNYMRMYWGKKLLEWSETPEEAFKTALYLNNKYSLDGRDPNSYAGVAWCFGKHDHPFQERPVYGKIRSMSASGLRKKPGLEAYAAKMRQGDNMKSLL